MMTRSKYTTILYEKNWSLRKMGYMLEIKDDTVIVYLGMGKTFIVKMYIDDYVKDYSVEAIVQLMHLEIEKYLIYNGLM